VFYPPGIQGVENSVEGRAKKPWYKFKTPYLQLGGVGFQRSLMAVLVVKTPGVPGGLSHLELVGEVLDAALDIDQDLGDPLVFLLVPLALAIRLVRGLGF
jgi:hypothetical protein